MKELFRIDIMDFQYNGNAISLKIEKGERKQ